MHLSSSWPFLSATLRSLLFGLALFFGKTAVKRVESPKGGGGWERGRGVYMFSLGSERMHICRYVKYVFVIYVMPIVY